MGRLDEILIPVTCILTIFQFTYRKRYFLDSEFIAITISILEKIRIQPSYQLYVLLGDHKK